MEEKREKLYFFDIICWYYLHYFNELNIKIEIMLLSKL